jgi:hypothetical protein
MKFFRRRVSTPDTTIPADTSRKLIDSLTCVICLEFMADPCVLSCGHSTCVTCWHEWRENNSTCPMCRAQSSEVKLQSAILHMVAQSLASVQPCGERILVKNRHQHERECDTCLPKRSAHIVAWLLNKNVAWENRQIRLLKFKRGLEWQTGDTSNYRQHGSVRVRNAIASCLRTDTPVPDFVVRWEERHRNEFGRIQVPLRVRSWLDGAEMRFRSV